MVSEGGVEAFLDYECRASQRYRRVLSLLFVRVSDARTPFELLAGDLVRSSDKVIGFDGGVAIIMGETPLDGARSAVRRYAMRCENGVRLQCGVALFPQDAQDPEQLMRAALRRYRRARQHTGEAFIWNDEP